MSSTAFGRLLVHSKISREVDESNFALKEAESEDSHSDVDDKTAVVDKSV
jgi:hypothetical protein